MATTKKTTKTTKKTTKKTKEVAARYGITNREAIRMARQIAPAYKACRANVFVSGIEIMVEFFDCNRRLVRSVNVSNAYATGLLG